MKVSILIPFYGDRYFQLWRALPFLLNQTYSNYEVIVLDDGRRSSNDISPESLVSHSKLKYVRLREGVVPIRSPNTALRWGFQVSEGEFIIAHHPEIIVPPDAVERMVMECDLERRNCSIQYHLTNDQMFYLCNEGLKLEWQSDLDQIKHVPDFWATKTPWGYTNKESVNYRNHFSFCGLTKKRFEEFMIPDTEEWLKDDCYIHELELKAGELAVPIDIEIYHQEHDRVYGTIEERSTRIQRIRNSQWR